MQWHDGPFQVHPLALAIVARVPNQTKQTKACIAVGKLVSGAINHFHPKPN
jgi:6,7-dimethyl-8-ribityllumazine synthase